MKAKAKPRETLELARLCDRLGGSTDLAMTARAPGHERE